MFTNTKSRSSECCSSMAVLCPYEQPQRFCNSHPVYSTPLCTSLLWRVGPSDTLFWSAQASPDTLQAKTEVWRGGPAPSKLRFGWQIPRWACTHQDAAVEGSVRLRGWRRDSLLDLHTVSDPAQQVGGDGDHEVFQSIGEVLGGLKQVDCSITKSPMVLPTLKKRTFN